MSNDLAKGIRRRDDQRSPPWNDSIIQKFAPRNLVDTVCLGGCYSADTSRPAGTVRSLVVMPMMQIRVVRVCVAQGRVTVPVRMRLGHRAVVDMLVVIVMRMAVIVV